MEARETEMTLTERLEAMLAVLSEYRKKTGQAFAPRMLRSVLRYFVRSEGMTRAVLTRAAQLGILDPEVTDGRDGIRERVLVKALLAGTGLFSEGERQALCLLYGLEDGKPNSATRVAENMNMSIYTVHGLDLRFRRALRCRLTPRKRIRDFYA